MNWYQLGVKETLNSLGTSENGLSPEKAKSRFAQYGPNKLVEEEKISRLKILLHQFTSPLIYILLIAGLVTLLLKEYIDSGVMVTVVILNAVIGFFQEYKAEESVRALKRMVVPKARVIRDVSRILIERTLMVGLIISAGVVYNFVTALNAGDSLEKARTVAVTTIFFSSSSRHGTAAPNLSRYSA